MFGEMVRLGEHDEKAFVVATRKGMHELNIRRATCCAAGLARDDLFVWAFGRDGLVGPDEPRYAWIARAMATTGIGLRRACTGSRGLKSRCCITGRLAWDF